MAVCYDDETGGLVIIPDECPDCGSPWYDTGCCAPGCFGQWCPECGTGCDIEVDPDHGACALAVDGESGGEAEERIDRERAAFGLRPLTGG